MKIAQSIAVLMALALAACHPPVGDDPASRSTGGARDAKQSDETPASQDSRTADEADSATSDMTMNVRETAVQYQARSSDESAGSTEGMEAVRYAVACANCHGPEGGGNLALHAPKIGGLDAWYIARQLKLFKLGLRGGTDEDLYGTYMRSIVLMITEAGIEKLAAHFAALDPEPLPKAVEGDASHGEEIYAVCSACHGERAEGNAKLNTPSLDGQSGPYMVRQLEHYRTGLRAADPADIFGQQMLPIVQSTLKSRQDSVDVVAYIESLNDETEASGTESVSESGR